MTQKKELKEFQPLTPENLRARKNAKKICHQINGCQIDQVKLRLSLFKQLFGKIGKAFIENTFYCDYGHNIFIEDNFFANHNCVLLDADEIHIGENVMLGPNVHLYTTTHPLTAEDRRKGIQLCAPIHIGNDVWIGGNSVIMPGISIGDRSVIGAGSIVTQSIPNDVVAAGNPCKVLRTLT